MYGSSVGRTFKVRCPDNKVRTATTTAEPDTYFTQPARVQVNGKSVSGYISGCSTHEYHFRQYSYGKNAKELPEDNMVHYNFAECD